MNVDCKFIVLFLVCGLSGFCQQNPQYTQYMYNVMNINPAYAGQREVLSIFGLHRSQWVGIEGAPSTSTVALHAPINDSKLGVGISFENDRIGPSSENKFTANLSYTIDFSDYYKLSFGLNSSVTNVKVDYTKLDIYDPNDISYQNNVNKFSPNFGAGLYLHSDYTYVSVSVPGILETKHYSDNEAFSTAKQKMHLYLMGGHVFEVNPLLLFKPSLLVKLVQGTSAQVDLSANFLLNEKFTAGISYRFSSTFSGMAGFQVTDGLFVGYAYDREISKISNFNSGSHELFLRFEVFEYFDRIVSPRFF
ncbi:PorP/SprF family type IX secretion system membrane protein [Flavobacterium lipolyticum]|uniref:Type IX secretion system membrane protein PorP/SprF n=1 Tax=Flavobacterium lipolyticum TaxID=2893754 RepID=A0ABS8M449_9FLAO|nr:type IX secretion system membrane protein PorP/SprF [Flavobacterium sp. F-126]MCC9019557.1 type IX secretion system membrane protein PorP/SprF [Flavobacterium sp. F-126]